MNWELAEHAVYLAAAVPLTIWVATTLSRHGHTYLQGVYSTPDQAASINRLLTVGFYLVNLGFVLLFLRVGSDVADATELVETVSTKIGVVMLATGALHFINLSYFNGLIRRAQLMARPPVPPAWTPPQYPQHPAPTR